MKIKVGAFVLLLALAGPVLAMGDVPKGTELGKQLTSIKPAGGATTFRTIADTWVYAFRPDKNYGDGLGWKDITNPGAPYSVPRIFIGFGGSDVKIGLLKFDLSGLDKSRPVKNASLKLYNCFAGSDAAVKVDAKRITQPWSETTVTYKTRPAAGVTVSTTILQGGRNYNDPGKWYDFDVTGAVQAWQGGAENDGIMLLPQGESGVDFEFVCKESAGGAERGPLIEVSY
ncbi:MAG: DNRLRE domain-containing protein [Candidatus Margulisiibacteriota bacterium]